MAVDDIMTPGYKLYKINSISTIWAISLPRDDGNTIILLFLSGAIQPITGQMLYRARQLHYGACRIRGKLRND